MFFCGRSRRYGSPSCVPWACTLTRQGRQSPEDTCNSVPPVSSTRAHPTTFTLSRVSTMLGEPSQSWGHSSEPDRERPVLVELIFGGEGVSRGSCVQRQVMARDRGRERGGGRQRAGQRLTWPHCAQRVRRRPGLIPPEPLAPQSWAALGQHLLTERQKEEPPPHALL